MWGFVRTARHWPHSALRSFSFEGLALGTLNVESLPWGLPIQLTGFELSYDLRRQIHGKGVTGVTSNSSALGVQTHRFKHVRFGPCSYHP